ncbi:MAG: fasciclin domain-containing protein [Gemmatimonadota bacterium]
MLNFIRSNVRALLVPAAAFALTACDDDPVTPVDPGLTDDIVDIATSTGDVSTLATALEAAGLVGALQGDGPFTVFAPVNSAFADLGDGIVDALLEDGNAELLSRILTFHVVSGTAAFSGDLSDGQTVTTLEGEALTIGVSGGSVTVNEATVTTADIEATNGVIHLIDEVLVPSTDIVERAVLTPETQTLVAAVAAGDLVTTLKGDGPFTVFAPINEAFEALGTDQLDVLLAPENQALLQKILTYHVIAGDVRAADLADGASVATVEGTEVTFDLSGATPRVNGAEIIATDVVTENGVIHLIDGVLTENADIVDVATLNGFETLVSLVAEADLVTTLRSDNGGDGFTVFAPTDEAFAALAAVPSGQDLVDVLTYHVVGATVESGDLTDGQVVTTVEGSTFTVNIDGSAVSITDGSGNTVNVVLTDVPASNGVIHVIDGVLLPSS